MKRQTGSVSMDSQGEADQNERNDTKRLKLIHRSDGDHASLDEGTSTSHQVSVDTPQKPENNSNNSPQMQIENDASPKHNNGVESPSTESTPKTNGDQHMSPVEPNIEPSDNVNTKENSPPPPSIEAPENAASNGMNMEKADFSPTLPRHILEDSNECSSHSDTDIENSPSPHGSMPELTRESFLGESSKHELNPLSKATTEQLAAPDTKIWNFDVEHLTSALLDVTKLEGHADVVFSVAADDDIVLSSSGDTTIKVWNVVEKTEISSFRGHSDAVTSVVLLSKEQSEELCSYLSLSTNLRLAISASIDCYVKLWSVYTGEELTSIYTFNGITCLGYLQNQLSAIVGTDGGKLEKHNFCTKSVSSVLAHDDSVSELQVNDSYVYSASMDGSVKVWLIEEDEFQPLYTRRRKESSQDSKVLTPTRWKSLANYNDVLYMGDNSSSLKVLDWRAGRMKILKNQVENSGIIDAVLAKNDVLLSTFYEASSDSGGINVWHLPSMTYVCTITGDVQEICSLDMTQTSDGKLRIVSGGHQLLIWDFNFSLAPVADSPFYVCEMKDLGTEILNDHSNASSPVGVKVTSPGANIESEKSSSWCNVM